jgi:hypothetical protein
MADNRASSITPPHHPNYGVQLENEDILNLLQEVGVRA